MGDTFHTDLHLCAGYDGIGRGLELGGLEPPDASIFVEIEAYAAHNLANPDPTMTPEILKWAETWGIPSDAILDLLDNYIPTAPPPMEAQGHSEAGVQQRVRLAGTARGLLLMRNNVGVLQDDRGVPVRFGLANDSSAVNAQIKSSDLIGIRPVTITEGRVGTVIFRFHSIAPISLSRAVVICLRRSNSPSMKRKSIRSM